MSSFAPFSDLDGEEDALPPPHSRRTRLLALLIAGLVLGFVALAAGGSLFGRPPTPENTRPLPRLVPVQGAIH